MEHFVIGALLITIIAASWQAKHPGVLIALCLCGCSVLYHDVGGHRLGRVQTVVELMIFAICVAATVLVYFRHTPVQAAKIFPAQFADALDKGSIYFTFGLIVALILIAALMGTGDPENASPPLG